MTATLLRELLTNGDRSAHNPRKISMILRANMMKTLMAMELAPGMKKLWKKQTAQIIIIDL